MRSIPGQIAIIAILSGCAGAHQAGQTANPQPETLLQAEMVRSDGRAIGTVELVATGDALSLAVDVSDISPGSHGLHLHAIGRCDAPDFTTAGGHLDPGGRQHGLRNLNGSHLGDLPDLVATADGKSSPVIRLSGGRAETLAAIFDADGSALMIHAAPDDGVTDPSGNAGPRIACGVLQKH